MAKKVVRRRKRLKYLREALRNIFDWAKKPLSMQAIRARLNAYGCPRHYCKNCLNKTLRYLERRGEIEWVYI